MNRLLRRALTAVLACNLSVALMALVVVEKPSALATPTSAPPVAAAEPPTHVRVRNVDVAASVVPVGILESGELAVPSTGTVGWYRAAPAGKRGALVLVGHVDSPRGPDVFFGLHKLRGGEAVDITLASGTVARYEVRSWQLVSKNEFPARVFAPDPHQGIWLITCGGRFDRRTRHYDSNLIVYAEPLRPGTGGQREIGSDTRG